MFVVPKPQEGDSNLLTRQGYQQGKTVPFRNHMFVATSKDMASTAFRSDGRSLGS